MTRLPAPPLDDARRIAALIGALLAALLAALLGLARPARARAPLMTEGTLTGVLCAMAAIDFETEPYVEWVAVPAPWRNGRLLPRRHARALPAQLRHRRVRSAALVHGPPAGFSVDLGV